MDDMQEMVQDLVQDLRNTILTLEREKSEITASWKEAVAIGLKQKERIRELESRVVDFIQAVGFFASVIKSGEPWTAQCQQRLEELKRHASSSSQSHPVRLSFRLSRNQRA